MPMYSVPPLEGQPRLGMVMQCSSTCYVHQAAFVYFGLDQAVMAGAGQKVTTLVPWDTYGLLALGSLPPIIAYRGIGYKSLGTVDAADYFLMRLSTGHRTGVGLAWASVSGQLLLTC
jgi:hypothetical protein